MALLVKVGGVVGGEREKWNQVHGVARNAGEP